MTDSDPDDWTLWWDARMAAFESVLGPSDELVGHATVPFSLGADIGGAADVVYFRRHIPGVVCVTSELIGNADQRPNGLGHYELLICHRNADEAEWGSSFISRLAYYTLDAALDPGDTLDIDPGLPEGSEIAALLFSAYARFDVREQPAGLLLCVGITADELAACRAGRTQYVESRLKSQGVYPYTILGRTSVLD